MKFNLSVLRPVLLDINIHWSSHQFTYVAPGMLESIGLRQVGRRSQIEEVAPVNHVPS